MMDFEHPTEWGEAGAWNIDDSIINRAEKNANFEHPTFQGALSALLT